MSIAEKIPGMKPGSRIRNGVLGVVYVLLVLTIIGAAAPSSDDPGEGAQSPSPSADTDTTTIETTQATTQATTQDTTKAATQETTTTTATTTKTTTTTTVSPAPDGESYQFSGSGNDVTGEFSTEGGLVVFDFEHDGSSNFQVQAVSGSGEKTYLVNEIGTYDGQVALYQPPGTYRLDVTADGSWDVDITQPRFNQNDIHDLPAQASGKHAAWFGPYEFDGSAEVTFEIKNDAQAGVWLATHEGEKIDLLHNEIGPYEGSALVTDKGVGLIIVDTDSADWRIEVRE
ncbi:hypothetical protein ACFQH6_20655 [Halobacteriaceae archaeon GCM10025711]